MFICYDEELDEGTLHFLLGLGVNVNFTTTKSPSLLSIANQIGSVPAIEALLAHGADPAIDDFENVLMVACRGDKIDVARFWIEKNVVDINAQNKYGDTALMLASQNGHKDVVQLLLEKNAIVDIQNKYGMTALMKASSRGDKKMVQLLLDHGADINLKNNDDKTAIDLAKTEEIKEMIQNHVNNDTSYVLK